MQRLWGMVEESRGLSYSPLDTTTAFNSMTDRQRAERLYQLYLQLDELTTAEEIEAYPFLEHLSDLIQDLDD